VIQEANGGDVTKQLVATGRAATSFMWSNQLPELQGKTKDELALVSYPGDPKGQWARASMYWSAFRGTRHPEVVIDVMNFLVNDPEVGKILGTERGLSPNTDVRKVVGEALTDPTARATIEFENAITPRFGAAPAPPPKGHAKIRSLLTAAAESVQLGQKSPKQAAEEFLSQANGMLAT
jgi:multiple sugar transport system substrate-binding protein